MPKFCSDCDKPITQFTTLDRRCGKCQFKHAMNIRMHTSRLNPIGPVTRNWMTTRTKWFKSNPPDQDGYYYCYLAISPLCPFRMKIEETTLDHVRARSRRPDLRFILTNLQPACSNCQVIKGSKDLSELVDEFPHLSKYIKPVYKPE